MDAEEILIVERDAAVRERVSTALVYAGYEVMVCPGPQGPTYSCVAGWGPPCPLTRSARSVVLGDVEGDYAMIGTPRWMMLEYYEGLGKSVVGIHELDGLLSAPVKREGPDGHGLAR